MTSAQRPPAWPHMPQADTFEAVRVNVYNLLGSLAMRLGGRQLDLMFGKFESRGCGVPQGDALLLGLLRRLAESDKEVRFRRRCRDASCSRPHACCAASHRLPASSRRC